jgi:phage shock protein C
MKVLVLSDDKKIFGVCGGIGEYFNIDPSVVRLGWMTVSILSGVIPGIIAYFVAAIIIPSKSNPRKKTKT